MSARRKRNRHVSGKDLKNFMSESEPKAAPTLFAAALPPKPEGEDFFLVAVVIDSDELAGTTAFDIVGTWEQVDQTSSAYVAGGRIRRQHTISIYQGDAARTKLLEGTQGGGARYQAQAGEN